uniref:Enoyl-[acyl-carrier-protein] reductase, mitochondrial n=2 Tax=Hirondellea gigas TaxID=1518452 RepID=A0A6A7G9X3_9CRUS
MLRQCVRVVRHSRSSRSFSTTARAAVYSSFGSPQKSLSVKEFTYDDPKGSEVLIRMLAAPINPSDVNMIEGSYPICPETEEKIGGNEGVGIIESVGSEVTQFTKGDRVLPKRPCFGTWRTYAVEDQSKLRKISNTIPIELAATISVNPCSAFRLLTDFANLSAGDVIVQNGCNSVVGQSIIQIAHSKGIKTINILRDRPDFAETVEYCKNLGGDIVVTEDYIQTAAFKTLIADMPRPKLAFNSVGGRSATDMARILEKGGTMITYGGMSRKPVTIPTGLLIFNDIVLKGFWLSKWTETHSETEQNEMISALTEMIEKGTLKWKIQREKFENICEILQTNNKSFSSGKKVLMF